MVNTLSEIHQDKLRPLFEQFGEVSYVDIHREYGSNRSKGFGFVQFRKHEDACAAIKNLNNYRLQGQYLTVKFVNLHDANGQKVQFDVDTTSNVALPPLPDRNWLEKKPALDKIIETRKSQDMADAIATYQPAHGATQNQQMREINANLGLDGLDEDVVADEVSQLRSTPILKGSEARLRLMQVFYFLNFC